MTQAISTSSRQEEQHISLRTQAGGNGNGGMIIVVPFILGSDDNEPQAAVREVETFLLRQRINRLLNVTCIGNVITTPLFFLREQRASATFAIFEDGGAV